MPGKRSLREHAHGALLALARSLEVRHAPAPRWETVRGGPLAGRQLLLDTKGAAWQSAMRDGHFESWLYEALSDIAAGGVPVAWDIGAHIGYHSLGLAAALGPAARVVSFEPAPMNAARLEMNLQRNPDLADRVELHRCLVGGEDGEGLLSLGADVDDGTSSGSAMAGSLAVEVRGAYREHPVTRVPMRSLDSLLGEGVPPPWFVKIDIEGAEAVALEAAEALLSGPRPHVCVEVHNVRAAHDVAGLFRVFGYTTKMLHMRHRGVGHVWAYPPREGRA